MERVEETKHRANMSLSSVIKQTEEVLEDVLQTIRKESKRPCPVLSETDRNKFVEEEGSLREQLEEIRGTESNCSSWRRLRILQPSPQPKCLKDAQELLQRVKGDINTKVRTWLAERSSLPQASPSCGPSLARTSGHDAGLSLVEGNTEPTSVIITPPLNMRCSLSEVQLSDLHVNPAVRNDRGYASDINEAINAPLGVANVSGAASESGDGARNSSSRPRRRTPPPPPLFSRVALPNNSRASSEASSESGDGARNSSSRPRRRTPPPPPFLRVAPSNNSRVSSVASSNSGSDSSPRSPPVRRPAPPPPQSPGRSRDGTDKRVATITLAPSFTR
ncbi:hypothetical protein V8E55_005080 [Tylopilus felleus]